MTNVTTLLTSKAAPISWVESLFVRMQGMYGSKFLDMWRDTNTDVVKSLWAEEMGKLTAEELKRGYAALMTRDWPPSLPEYVKMCKPTVEPLVAYYEAVAGCAAREKGAMGEWSHPAVYWASVKIGAYDLKHCAYLDIKVRWERAFETELAKGEWADIPVPMLGLPEPGKSILSRESADQMVKALKAEGVVKDVKDKTDHKRWAKKIIVRAQKTHHGYNALQLRLAHEALEAR